MKRYKDVRDRICPICGKKFVPAPFHIYRAKARLVCSWACVRKFEKDNGIKLC